MADLSAASANATKFFICFASSFQAKPLEKYAIHQFTKG